MPGEKFSSQKGNRLGDEAGDEDKRTQNLRTLLRNPQMGTVGLRYIKAQRGPDPQAGGGHDANKVMTAERMRLRNERG